jgi:carbonic anhydrase
MVTHFLRLFVVAFAVLVVNSQRDVARAVESSDSESKTVSGQPISADAALELLKAGNKRFVSGQSKHPHEGKNWRKRLASGQKPFATILGCSDSRVIPELIFDEGLGDLFVIRVAGNIVDQDVKGSIEYAVDHLDTHLVVVLGHENCGAVTAAMAKLNDDEPQELTSLVRQIHDTIYEHHDGEPDVDSKTSIETAVRKNVMCGVRQLKDCPDLSKCVDAHNVKVVGAIYDLDTGRVDWLE